MAMKQPLRFLVVGCINSAFGYGVFVVLLFFGLNYATALLLATIVGAVFNFCTTGRLVFDSANYSLFFRFIGSYSVVYLIHVAGLQMLACAGVDMYIAGFICLLPVALLGFFINKKFVFVK